MAALGALALSACDKTQPAPAEASKTPTPIGETGSPTPEPTVPASASALQTYKASISGIKAFMEAHQQESDSVQALERLRELVLRLTAVGTEGLPADLANAFNPVRLGMQRIQTAFDALPVPVDKFEKWMTDAAAKGGEAAKEAEGKMGTFVETMTSIQEELAPAIQTMNQVGAKYGVVALDLTGEAKDGEDAVSPEPPASENPAPGQTAPPTTVPGKDTPEKNRPGQ